MVQGGGQSDVGGGGTDGTGGTILGSKQSQRRHEEVQADLPPILGTNQQYPSNSGACAK